MEEIKEEEPLNNKTLANASGGKPKRDEKGRLLPGNTANPAGGKKGSFSLLPLLKKQLQECPEGKDKKSYAILIIEKMISNAVEKGDVNMLKLIWNYIEGMPKQSFEVGGDKENPIALMFQRIYDKQEPFVKDDPSPFADDKRGGTIKEDGGQEMETLKPLLDKK